MPFSDRVIQLEYQRRWTESRRSEFFTGKVCVRCGSAEDLQLDHIDPKTKVSHRIWSWSRERAQEELAKCQILCRKCHGKKTWKEDYAPDHGAHAMYEYHKCRCALCRAWKSAKNRRYRESVRWSRSIGRPPVS